MFFTILFAIQFIFSVIIGIYFFRALKSQNGSKSALSKEDDKELAKFRRLSDISLTVPLAEMTRPQRLEDVIGQQSGIKALRAALCGKNPQHVIIYGPPGVGKTAAARIVLEEAKGNMDSPFKLDAKYVELDATTLRFDDRGIADPLMGSVHDPIYQGAGAYGPSGIPRPRPGAVTKAHGGILFIDEIGELHPIQMNKLLKVLEDRRVYLESAYYSASDTNIPKYIHEMFRQGLPADFRLVAATTRSPEELPPALRSRCVEVYFQPLTGEHVKEIAKNAALRTGAAMTPEALELIPRYADNGRDAVNIVQIAASVAALDGHSTVDVADVEWVVESGRYNPKIDKVVQEGSRIGCVTGLAVYGNSFGTVMDIEATASKAQPGQGQLTVTGMVDTEQYDHGGQTLVKQSSARASVENMLTVLKRLYGIDCKDYDLHINFPCSAPVDGPSAGIAIVCAVYSAITEIPVDGRLAMTGELSIKGTVKPVGGVAAKVEAAIQCGATTVLIPKDNYRHTFDRLEAEIVPVQTIGEVLEQVFRLPCGHSTPAVAKPVDGKIAAATSLPR